MARAAERRPSRRDGAAPRLGDPGRPPGARFADPVTDAVLVLDCGATNVRAIAVSAGGRILASRAVPNATASDPTWPGGLIWDHERIWRDLAGCARGVAGEAGRGRIGAATVTTFGVDGTLVDQRGAPLHPVIAWPCERTREVVARVHDALPGLYTRCGLQPFPFNTVYKLAWLRMHRPALLERAHAWLFISDLFLHRMTGALATDVTMAGTSGLTDLATRDLAPGTLGALGLPPALFPPLAEPGAVVGALLPGPASELGLPAGLPVVSAGHDTQFALFGSGASENEPVLSSGTWEILMVRARRFRATEALRTSGVTVELDVEPGLHDPGTMWLASGLVERLKRLAFGECAGDAAYEAMIAEGAAAGAGSGGLRFSEELLEGTRTAPGMPPGSRGQLARALFEHLAVRTRDALAVLERAGGFRADACRCVGGGSRNRLWNRIRADVLGRPVLLVDRKETTALGAACFALPATGAFRSAAEARDATGIALRVVEPGPEASFYAHHPLTP